MPQAGIMPDCVHCRFMIRQQDGEYRCRQHEITLHTPIRIFCKSIAPPIDKVQAYAMWFEESINRQQLEPNVLYTWIATTLRNAQGEREVRVDHEQVALLTIYMLWSAGTFWQMMRRLRNEKHDFYRQHGYDVD